MTVADIIKNVINDYVSKHGSGNVLDREAILKLAHLGGNTGGINLEDYCYNRMTKGPEKFKGPFLLEYISPTRYRILGEKYKYNDQIMHKPANGNEYVVGRWFNGKCEMYQQSFIGSRDRESLKYKGVILALIQEGTKTVVYTSVHIAKDISTLKKIFSSKEFANPRIVINPAHIKNPKDVYYAKCDFYSEVNVDLIRETLVQAYLGVGRKEEKLPNDINVPVSPRREYKKSDGTVFYTCSRCGVDFKKNRRCPECGQLMKETPAINDNSKTICIGENISGMKIYEIINKYFGENYNGWMKASYRINGDYWAWFPTISPDNVRPNGGYGGTEMWSNTLSKDKKTVISVNHDATIDEIPYTERNNKVKMERVLIFARINGSFEFLGVFDDKLVVENRLQTYRHDRIARGINLSTFELID